MALFRSAYEIFMDPLTNRGLEDGYIYLGAENTNPEITANQLPIFWDELLTIPAAQPVRTIAGYASRNGSPAKLFLSSNYSITVRDKHRNLIYTSLSEKLADNLNRGLTLAALLAAALVNGGIYDTTGHTTAIDGGHGTYYFLAGDTTTANGVTVVQTTLVPGRLFLVHNGAVDSRQGGAKPDDSTNNRSVFFATLGASGVYEMVLDGGTYRTEACERYTDSVSGAPVPAGVRMYSNQILTIKKGATLKQVPWGGVGSLQDDSGTIVGAYSIENVLIKGGGKIQGNFTPGGSYPSRDNSSNHGIHAGNCTNVTLEDVEILNCWGDGYTSSYVDNNSNCDNTKNFNAINIYSHDNRRNNASLVGNEGFCIVGGHYRDVPSVADGGVSPWAGIDLEPNDAATSLAGGNRSKVRNGTVSAVSTSGNPFAGITIGPGTTTPSLEICTDIALVGCSLTDGLVLTKCSRVVAAASTIQNPKDDPSDPLIALNGILMLETTRCIVALCTVFNCNGDGIKLEQRIAELNSCDHNMVVANDIYQVSRKTNNTYQGIHCQSDSNLIAINKIRNAPGGGNQPQYAILATSTSTNNNILLNDTQDAGTTGTWLDQGTNNKIFALGGSGDKRFYFNTVSSALPSNTNQGLAIVDYALRQAYSGGGNATMQSWYDGVGLAGSLDVDGAQHLKLIMSGLANGPFITVRDGTPEGALSAPPGSLCLNLNATSAEYAMYMKRTGTGNTGWEGMGTVIP